ncbi:hypothetical protein B4U80_03341, partial [Leptotrombidium deliense]
VYHDLSLDHSIVFKNYYCALCNDINDTYCHSTEKAQPNQFSLRNLLNIRFDAFNGQPTFQIQSLEPKGKRNCKRIYVASTSRENTDNKTENNIDNSVEICSDKFYAVPRLTDKIQAVLSYFCLISSIFCLIIHLTVYSVISKWRTLNGKIVMSLSLSLLIAHMSFLSHDSQKSRAFCVMNAILIHYFFLCSFFW